MRRRFKNLREFIRAIDEIGQLRRVSEKVSPVLEISKYTDAESKKPGGGKALFFENVVDNGRRAFPVATNLFGSKERMALALGVEDIEDAANMVRELLETAPPSTLAEKFRLLGKLLPLAKISPKTVSRAPCQEVVMTGEDIDLSEIPVLKCWPQDGGRFVTLPLVFTKSAESGRPNLGMYRLQIFDKSTTGMHWHIHKDASHYYSEYSRQKKPMPVAVAIGADPSVIYAATAPMPRGVDELLLAGFFRGKGVEMVECKTVPLKVPAEAEFVLEGYVEPDERRLEGPFGDHTGYYSLADMYPVFHLSAITRRREPIYCATLVGPPPMEDCYMAKATERIFLPMLQTVLPEIKDYFLPWEGVFHNIAVVSIDKEYPAHAQRLMSALWGQGQMSFCKAIVVVDKDTRPSDYSAIARLFSERFDPQTDITLSYGVLDALDHSAPRPFAGAKIGVDLTARVAGEPPRNAAKPAQPSEDEIAGIKKWLAENLGETASVAVRGAAAAVALKKAGRRGRDILRKAAECPNARKFLRLIAIFDAEIDTSDASKMLWKIFNNTDPARDIIIDGSLALIDACKKNAADGHTREWPDELSFNK